MEPKIQQLENQISELQKQLFELRNEYYKDNFIATQVFTKAVEFKGGVTLDSINPTYFSVNGTPATTQSSISSPSGGATVDTESRNAINSILAVLDTFGLTA